MRSLEAIDSPRQPGPLDVEGNKTGMKICCWYRTIGPRDREPDTHTVDPVTLISNRETTIRYYKTLPSFPRSTTNPVGDVRKRVKY